MNKRETPKDVLARMMKSETRQDLSTEAEKIDENARMVGFTIRMPEAQKEALERHLWKNHGEKLATGVRRIVVEWMRANGAR